MVKLHKSTKGKTNKWRRRVLKSDKAQRASGPIATADQMKAMLRDILKNENLSKSQKNRRTKQVLNTIRDVTNARVKAISATGHALAENITPTITASIVKNNAVNQANSLVSAGANYNKNNTTDKRKDEDSTSYGDYR